MILTGTWTLRQNFTQSANISQMLLPYRETQEYRKLLLSGYFTAGGWAICFRSFIFCESNSGDAQEEGPQGIINILKLKRCFLGQCANTPWKESCDIVP